MQSVISILLSDQLLPRNEKRYIGQLDGINGPLVKNVLVGEMLIKKGLDIFEEKGHGANLLENFIIGKELTGTVKPVAKHQDVRDTGNIFWYNKNRGPL